MSKVQNLLGGAGSKSKGEISYMLMVMERRRNGTDWFAQEIEFPAWEDMAQTCLGSGSLPLQVLVAQGLRQEMRSY